MQQRYNHLLASPTLVPHLMRYCPEPNVAVAMTYLPTLPPYLLTFILSHPSIWRQRTYKPYVPHPRAYLYNIIILIIIYNTQRSGLAGTDPSRRISYYRPWEKQVYPQSQFIIYHAWTKCARTLTIPPPRIDVACYVSNIPTDDPKRDVARNVSTDKGMYRKSESKK